MLDGLIQQHGKDRVWQAGIDALGYPATWIHQKTEVEQIEAVINK